MRTKLHHILSSGLFTSIILFLFLGSSYTVLSQEQVIPITNPNTTTWDVPAGVTSVTVECWGAGGSGGASLKSLSGGGSGGGAYSRSLNIVVVPNTTVNIQIGTGAPAPGKNQDGGIGGNTWFLTAGTVYAEGGTGGTAASGGASGTGGAGGLATNGIGNDTTLSGVNGTDGSGVQGGDGGAGANGGGAGGAGGNSTDGNPGLPPGGGGGGSGDNNAVGGAGADGQIILTYTPGAVCNLTNSGLANILCNDEGTTSDPLDDTFSFTLNPTGTDLGSTYSVSGSVTRNNISYGGDELFNSNLISGGNLTITITDDTTGACQIVDLLVTAPATCSPDCNLTSAGLTNILCNDEGTTSDPLDDTFSFDLNPTGNNLGTTYSVSGGYTQANVSYGSATTFSGSLISNGNLTITITDDTTGACQIVDLLVTAPASCSSACNLTSAGLTNILCNDEGTTSNPLDDTFSFDLNPTGDNIGTTYSVSGGYTQSGVSYGSATTFSGSLISNGNLTITITDDTSGTCQIVDLLVTAPASCSPDCNLTSAGLTNILCNDEGTTSDPLDDTFSFDLNPTGNNLGTTYSVSGGYTQATVSYGSATTFSGSLISDGNLTITITDDTSGTCQIVDLLVTAPASCSSSCNLTSAGLTNILCNDAGTTSNPSDDTFSFDLNPTGTGIGTTYSVSGDYTQAGVSYGSATTFSGSLISNGNLTITITDDTSGTCQIVDLLVTAPATCSPDCNLTSAGLTNILCNDEGTTSDPLDDTFSFDLNPTGNNLGTTYSVSGGYTQATVSYGSATTFSGSLISNGNLTITITDDTTGACQILDLLVTAPASCSSSCNLTSAGLTNILCNDAGTTSNPSDDTFSFDLNPTGTGIGATYSVSGDYTQSGVSYGSATTFSGSLISNGNLTITITDDTSGTCQIVDLLVTAPATCSPDCNLTSAGLTNLLCYNGGTGSDPGDDTFTFNLKPSGYNLGSTYSVSGDISQSGLSYGVATNFGPYSIASGNLTITITDDATGSCQIVDMVITAPTSCSVPDHTLINCTSCHITHNAPGSNLTNVGGNALLCQSCHISTGAASTKSLVNANNIALNPGTGNSHAWDVDGINLTYNTNLPTNNDMFIRMPEDPPITGPKQLICSTCHNQHNNGNAGSPYLRVDNTGDAMCKDCHSARDVGIYSDAPATNKGSHPVGVTYDDTDTRFNNTPTLITNGSMVQCSTCHGVHDVTGSLGLAANGNLLRTTNDASLCTDCHTYSTHNGMDCLDCHQVHNTNKGNIYMIRNTITTPNSGDKPVEFTARGGATGSYAGTVDGSYTGICEVCHTTTSHFQNDGTSTDQIHTSQPGNIPEANCTTCHPHSANFSPAGGGCVACHQDNTTYPYLTGNWQISDAHVSHTLKYNYDCSTCHFERGSGTAFHIDGTVDSNFNPNGLATRNGQDSNTPSWNGTTCSSIYCHSNGKTADRGIDDTYSWGARNASGLPFGGETRVGFPELAEAEANNYATQIIPNWDGGSITACTDCHGGLASLPPDPYDITDAGPYQATVLADFPYTGGHGPITTQHFSGNEANWGGGTTQCFWCHDVDDRTAAGGVKKQGTYGTSFHVDGETRFRIGWTTEGGTGNVSVPRMETSGHCSGKTCWSGG